MIENYEQIKKKVDTTNNNNIDSPVKNPKTIMTTVKKIGRNLYFESFKLISSFRKLPDFVIIGTQKGGTSSLYNYLSQHPDTQLLHPKEVHYYDMNYNRGLSWYKNHFPAKWNKKLTGEASPYYIYNPYVAKRVHADLPHVKIIILLRDPIARAFSHYKMNVKNGIESLSFEEAIDKENERLQEDLLNMQADELFVGKNHRRYSYIKRGFYDEQLAVWLKYFPLEQMTIIKSEDFFEDSEKVVKQVFDFLKLKSNANGINYSNKNKGIPGEMNETTRIKLKSLFEEQTEKLRELTGKTFLW